jgi:hypothetical protein
MGENVGGRKENALPDAESMKGKYLLPRKRVLPNRMICYRTVDPEILGSRVCGGSKIAKKKKIRKMLDLLQLPLDASPLANTLLMNSLLFTTGLSELKYRRKQAEKHLEVLCSFRLRSVQLRLLIGTFGPRTLA